MRLLSLLSTEAAANERERPKERVIARLETQKRNIEVY